MKERKKERKTGNNVKIQKEKNKYIHKKTKHKRDKKKM